MSVYQTLYWHAAGLHRLQLADVTRRVTSLDTAFEDVVGVAACRFAGSCQAHTVTSDVPLNLCVC